MENPGTLIVMILIPGAALAAVWTFWRYIWFDRNPERRAPEGDNVLSPADGTVVYARRVGPNETVVSIKKGRALRVSDLLRKDTQGEKVVIGVFMSPFNVHVNRVPLSGTVESIHHHPPIYRNRHMGSMHWRSLVKRFPLFEKSPHLAENERTVIRIRGILSGRSLSCYVNLIAGGSVNGIQTFVRAGEKLSRGDVLSRIRVGSQVDTVISWRPDMTVRISPGQKVRAGRTVMIDFAQKT